MTKKEQAAFDALKQELRIARALRFTDNVEPDVEPPTKYGERTQGYVSRFYLTSFGCGCEVQKGASTFGSHWIGDQAWIYKETMSWSQGKIRLHSKRSDALKAARYKAVMEYARQLALVDVAIEKALAEENGDV